METLRILYQDPWYVAVHKPEGLLVHRTPLAACERRSALQEARRLVGRHLYPLHRLDRPTSGVLLFASDRDAARAGISLFRQGAVEKKYLAVVRGWLPDEGTIRHPLKDDLHGVPGARNGDGTPRDAVTLYRRLAGAELPYSVSRYPTTRYSLAEACPVTGRRRQIRRHFAHIFHPVVGDTTYGEGRHNRFFREHFGCFRLLLASVSLTFAHPFTGQRTSISCLPNETFLRVIRALQWEEAANLFRDCGLL